MTWFANLLIIWGTINLSDKKRWAFLLIAAGESIWTGCSLWRQQWDIMSICLIFSVLAVRNWLNWGKKTDA